MFNIDCYIPTRVIFGPGRIKELEILDMPGSKAVLCMVNSCFLHETGLLDKVKGILQKRGIESVIYDKITPNPCKWQIMEAASLARKNGCDFCIGLGGGSSIDAAKATAAMMVMEGDLWDYAYTGTGGRKEITGAAPVVAVTTTSGTGTETDPYCVITNESTGEKLDFACDKLFPVASIIDPELMTGLSREQTIYQGFDAFFHAEECFIVNQHNNKLVDIFAEESVRTVFTWLPKAADEGKDMEARTYMAYAADILSGYTQSLINTTSHHIIAQYLGGKYPDLPHGLSLIAIAEAYYKKIIEFVPDALEELGVMMGGNPVPGKKGENFIKRLTEMLDAMEMRRPALSGYGMKKEDIKDIAKGVVDDIGLDCDIYRLTAVDVEEILEKSYR